MKKHTFRRSIVVFLILLLVAGLVYPQAEKKPFFIADDVDFPPFCSGNEQGMPEGIFYDVISEAFRRMEIPFTYKVYPWKRAQLLVKNGEADAMITVPTPERLQFVTATKEPVIKENIGIFARADNPKIEEIKKIKTISDLEGFKIVDYLGDGWAEANLKDLNVSWSKNMENTLKMLALNRADIFIQGKVITKHLLKDYAKDEANKSIPFDQIIETPHILQNISYCLLIRKDSPYISIMDKFDSTMQGMRRDGTLQRIYDKYLK